MKKKNSLLMGYNAGDDEKASESLRQVKKTIRLLFLTVKGSVEDRQKLSYYMPSDGECIRWVRADKIFHSPQLGTTAACNKKVFAYLRHSL